MHDNRLEKIESQLCEIRLRNERVESDKAWETSGTRLITICSITYLVACAVLYIIGVERFWLGALMPVVGYYLSSLSLPPLKQWWINKRRQ